ncbi:hypothetical protein LTR56_002587 [Elasticomyces elasticus]|nr:hypothetical protein LTR22_013489 [Elasticomyces elasticus]KAK3657073.1 hypothetical protein LTR56_002587 [Elasticomyces elasticus]KAK4926698.1 hypothetical protein LTR49_006380 [Elasticomyces elasticus]KAK5762351.1 hypothetical protein LTS12_007510 [Elasticomyces elasticus]
MAMPPPSDTSAKLHLGKLQNELLIISRDNYEGRHFIPKTTLSKLLTEEVVERCLNTDTRSLLKTVCNSARNVFATLALSSNTPGHFHSTLQELIALRFTDADLPIKLMQGQGAYYAVTIETGDPDRVPKRFGPTFHDWSMKEVQDFCDAQWRFLAPVFTSKKKFVHYLDCKQPLPFTKLDKVSGDGHFADVRKAFLHPEHQEGFAWWCEADTNSQLSIAVKEYKITAGTDVAKRAWEGEARVCEQMPRHKHIVERIAAVAQADRYYLLMAWADGGDLKSFWQNNPAPIVSGEQTMEILEQFLGLASATFDMHTNKRGNSLRAANDSTMQTGGHSTPIIAGLVVDLDDGELDQTASSHWRHGDLKSENILRFTDGKSWLGILKMADLGLAKSHNQNTAHRQDETSTEYATTQYEAPEAKTHPSAPRSRLYDIWSVGCILLETVIWYLYGFERLEHFGRTGISTFNDTLYYTTTDSSARVSDVASFWIGHILDHDPECKVPGSTALGDLLRLVQQKLLVVAISDKPESVLQERRIDAGALCEALKAIVSKAKADPKYLCTGINRAGIPAPDRSIRQTAGALLSPGTANKRPKLDLPRQLDQNEWSIYADDQFARGVHDVLKAKPADEPPMPPTRLCERCKAFDFHGLARIEDTMVALESRASRCGLCDIISRAMKSRSSIDVNQTSFMLRLVKSGLVLGEGKARQRILEACKWPMVETHDTTPHVRLGLPRRLRSDNTAHPVILRQWLKECDLHHPQCLPIPGHSSLTLTQRPTRVIDVGTQGGTHVQLLETNYLPLQTSDESRYVALSYAWGDNSHSRFLATAANYDVLKRGISTTDLPKTFKDAIIVTRELGIRYLWIDGLCILQGPGGDFDTEAERMEVVFSNAYCVIAASRATGTSDGFLGERHDHRVVAIPRLGGAQVYLFEPIDDFQHDVIDGHLNKRGWVLQERALARRTIFFTGSQTYWQCGHGVRCETMTRLENKEAAFLGDPNFPKVAEDGSKGAQIHLYELLYRNYSTLAFMNAIDRPIGIAGLESRLVRAFGTDGGFGIFEKYLHRGIMWQRASSEVQRISFSRAVDEVPSWSWMAYQGTIDQHRLDQDTLHAQALVHVSWSYQGFLGSRSMPLLMSVSYSTKAL